jgi:N-formylglutamate deformylase
LNPEPPKFIRVEGRTPLIISVPHSGTYVPAEIRAALTPAALRLADTDWHVQHLYAFARELGAAWLQAEVSRYAIDLNRPPDNQSLYPGQTTSELCPTLSFAGEPLYHGDVPSAAEVARRREQYWMPYHLALSDLIGAATRRHGFAILLDAHSIRGVVPRLFGGHLPDINLGTFDGRSCDPGLVAPLTSMLDSQQRFGHVLNGRFKGGYITRHYGAPAKRVQALQIELAQDAYMDEAAMSFEPSRAQPLQALLQQLVGALLSFSA